MSKKQNVRRSFSSSRSQSLSSNSDSSINSSSESWTSGSSSHHNSKSSNRSKCSNSGFTTSDEEKHIIKDKKKSISSSKESVNSFTSFNSNTQSLDEFDTPCYQNLPLNVLELLLSIRNSEIKTKNLKIKHELNQTKLKYSSDQNSDIGSENDKIADELVKESSEIISLNEAIYGSNHFKTAFSHINLALIYLECKHLPKQAKKHCEIVWHIKLNNLKLEDYITDEKNEMILNFVYGRSCILLKENKEGESSLEKAEEHLYNWKSEMQTNNLFKKMKSQIYKWQKKIFFALAKAYAINGSYSNALSYYDKVIEIITKRKNRIIGNEISKESLNEIDLLLVDIYDDKSKVEQNRENFRESVDLIKQAIKIAENNGSLVMLADCKLNLGKVYSQLDDITSSSNAESLLNECIKLYEDLKDDTKIFKVLDEMIKLNLKQERYDDACSLLNSLIKKQINYYGDFSLKVSNSYKILCSVYLKRHDMSNAVTCLQKSLELDELNFGPKHKKTMETKKTLENFKKNPNLQVKLKKSTSKNLEKPSFIAVKRIDYSKDDKKLYSNAEEEAIKKIINPLK